MEGWTAPTPRSTHLPAVGAATGGLHTTHSHTRIGDLLLTKDGTLGRLALVDRENVCINQSVAVLRATGVADSPFLAALLDSPIWQQEMLLDVGGSTIKHIYITVVDKMIVGWPRHSEEREAIVARLQACESKIDTEREERDKLLAIKAGLMRDLLTGRVRVTGEAISGRSV